MTRSPKDTIKVAFCITDLDVGGAERALVRLVTGLDRVEWEPHVFCLADAGPLAEELADSNIPVTCFGAPRKSQLTVIYRLWKALRILQPQILQTYLYHANIAGRIAGRLAGVPKIVSGIRVAEKRSKWPLQIDRVTNWLVDRNVCVSNAVRAFSIRCSGLRPEKTIVIPNGVDVEAIRDTTPVDLSQFGIPPNNRTVLFVGRLDNQKAPLDLLLAVQELLMRFDDLHVLVVGAGPLEGELKRWIANGSFGAQIHLAGWQPNIGGLMKSAFCLALPSRWEGMPNVVLEAMAAGLPVVATSVEGIEELISDRDTGITVSPGNPGELRAGIEWLLEHPGDSHAIARKAQAFISNDLTSQHISHRYAELYRELVAQ